MNARAHNVERWISICLRVGVWASAALMLSGLIITAIQPGTSFVATGNPTLTEFWQSLSSGSMNGSTVTSAGLVLLMFTPFLRVLTALAGFISEKDVKFSAISLVILLILVGELIYSIR